MISPVVALSAFRSALLSAAPDANREFNAKYPEEIRVVLDNKQVETLNLTYSQLSDFNRGWEYLSSALYGDGKYRENLKKLNGGADTPMSAMNLAQKGFCMISEKYCAPVLTIRAKSLKAAQEKNEAKTKRIKVTVIRQDGGPEAGPSPADQDAGNNLLDVEDE